MVGFMLVPLTKDPNGLQANAKLHLGGRNGQEAETTLRGPKVIASADQQEGDCLPQLNATATNKNVKEYQGVCKSWRFL